LHGLCGLRGRNRLTHVSPTEEHDLLFFTHVPRPEFPHVRTRIDRPDRDEGGSFLRVTSQSEGDRDESRERSKEAAGAADEESGCLPRTADDSFLECLEWVLPPIVSAGPTNRRIPIEFETVGLIERTDPLLQSDFCLLENRFHDFGVIQEGADRREDAAEVAGKSMIARPETGRRETILGGLVNRNDSLEATRQTASVIRHGRLQD